jgi:hypothetical protein
MMDSEIYVGLIFEIVRDELGDLTSGGHREERDPWLCPSLSRDLYIFHVRIRK